MKHLIKLLKGICIGIANIVPGFSSGTMAIMLNIYDEFVSAFADIVKHPIKVIKKSWAIFIGMLIGIVIALLTVVKLLEVATFPTIMFFVGLVLGIIPESYKKVEFKPFRISSVIALVATILVVVGLPLLNSTSLGDVEMSIVFVLSIGLMGMLSASAMVLPGVSGSMILMVFGYYTYIISVLHDGLNAFLSFNFGDLLNVLVILGVFLIGVIAGVVLVSGFVRKVYTKHENLFNTAVLGLLFASPVSIMIASNKEYNGLFNGQWWMYLIGVFTLVGGIVLSIYGDQISNRLVEVSEEQNSKNKNEENK